MRKILATALLLLMCGCAFEVKPTPDVTQALNQHTAVLNAITAYIADLQVKGVLPKPEAAK